MNILSAVYERIVQCPAVPPERGGIIGTKGDTVCCCFFDDTSFQYGRAIYIPDTDLLNSQIQKWQEKGIDFCGVFHSHPVNQPELSADDLAYIKAILRAMPANIKELYFPVVLPGKCMLSFKASYCGNNIYIREDKINIIKEPIP